MRKIITYIFIIALTAVLFTACGSKRNNTTANKNTPTDTVAGTTADVTADTAANKTADVTADTTADATADTTASNTPQESKSQNSDAIISEEEAKGIALKDANLADSEISRLQIKLERDDGIQKYEVDFHSGRQEYDYEIDAASGKILEKDTEPID